MNDLFSPGVPLFTSRDERRAHLVNELRLTRERPAPGKLRRRLLVAAIALGALTTASAAIALRTSLLDRDIEAHRLFDPATLQPAPATSFATIAQGTDWALIGWTSVRGICVDYVFEDPATSSGENGASGCGSSIIGGPPDTLFTQPSPSNYVTPLVTGPMAGQPWVICGPLAPQVARVVVEMKDGSRFPAIIYEAPQSLKVRLRFFLLRASEATSNVSSRQTPFKDVQVFNATGRLLQTFITA
jgi:hypothetical protein